MSANLTVIAIVIGLIADLVTIAVGVPMLLNLLH